MRHTLGTLLQYVLPQHTISRIVHRLARSHRVPLRHAFTQWFIDRYGVDMTEAGESDPRAYPDFNSFFTRALRPGARPLAQGENQICCPVDGFVSQLGAVHGTTLLQAKGHAYSVRPLLGGSEAHAERFRGGRFATLYLSPGDYHRIHMPLAGRLTEMVHVPGRLFSVSPACVEAIPDLFARNERVVCLFETEVGPMAAVLVGAINVGSIETVWAGEITPPHGRRVTAIEYAPDGNTAVALRKGEELGRFNLGSTVIVLFGPDSAVRWASGPGPGARVRMGQLLGEAGGRPPEEARSRR